MENPEEVLQWLEEVSRRRPASIPRALDEYLSWVARTGEPLFRWPLVRVLLKEKLLAVLADFRETPPGLELPPCPNVPAFDVEAMRLCFLARLDAFPGPPFTIQRICELLAQPRKHYGRIDKFMRAFEKNVLVVSTKEPEPYRRAGLLDTDTDTSEPQLDGSDANSDCNVDVEMDDASDWKDCGSSATRRSTVNGPLDPQQSVSETAKSEPSSSADMSDESDSPPIDEYSEHTNPSVDIFPSETGESSAIQEDSDPVKPENIPPDDNAQHKIELQSTEMDTSEAPTIAEESKNEDTVESVSTPDEPEESFTSKSDSDNFHKFEDSAESENDVKMEEPSIEILPPVEEESVQSENSIEFESTMPEEKVERLPFEPESCENAVDIDVCRKAESSPPSSASSDSSHSVSMEESTESSNPPNNFEKIHSEIKAADDSLISVEITEPRIEQPIPEDVPCDDKIDEQEKCAIESNEDENCANETDLLKESENCDVSVVAVVEPQVPETFVPSEDEISQSPPDEIVETPEKPIDDPSSDTNM